MGSDISNMMEVTDMAMTEAERKERQRAAYRRWSERNRETARQRVRRSMLKCRATFEGDKARRERDWADYGIIGLTIEKYNTMTEECGHTCEMCGQGNMHGGKPIGLDVDHCHKTHEVRGLLCHACNHRLGKIEKQGLCGPHRCGPDFAARAVAYLMTATLRRIGAYDNV